MRGGGVANYISKWICNCLFKCWLSNWIFKSDSLMKVFIKEYINAFQKSRIRLPHFENSPACQRINHFFPLSLEIVRLLFHEALL